MSDEYKLTKQDYQTRHQAERGYLCRLSRVMVSREAYSVTELAVITKIPQPKIYQGLNVLVNHGVVEKVESEPIEYPEWYEDAGISARRTWRRENGVDFRRSKTPTRWKRVGELDGGEIMKRRTWDQVIMEVKEKCVYPIQISKIMRICNLNFTAFRRLVDQGVLVYFDSKRVSEKGPVPKRYRAIEPDEKVWGFHKKEEK